MVHPEFGTEGRPQNKYTKTYHGYNVRSILWWVSLDEPAKSGMRQQYIARTCDNMFCVSQLHSIDKHPVKVPKEQKVKSDTPKPVVRQPLPVPPNSTPKSQAPPAPTDVEAPKRVPKGIPLSLQPIYYKYYTKENIITARNKCLTRKVTIDTRQEADTYVRLWNKYIKSQRERRIHPYQCPYCNLYHATKSLQKG